MFQTRTKLALPLFLLATTFAVSCGKSGHKYRAPEQPDIPVYTADRAAWYNFDSTQGGINVDRVYAETEFDHEVIVAVIDSGISPDHEDLKDHLWINPKEIPNNQIDDDSNGYIDDIHGWNYLVGKDRENIYKETLEVTRELRRLTNLEKIRPLDETEKAYLLEVRNAFDTKSEGQTRAIHYDLLSQQRGDDLDDFTNIDADHPAYGNNNINDISSHGTHVAGIIAAIRTNNIGIQGVADRARIMVLRAVPDGDEQDKDIYHAVRYAVDQGARIINMSFGKGFSPHQAKVQEAFQYAYEHNVLIVHAAGNASYDMDKSVFYPSRAANGDMPLNSSWLEVGSVSKGAHSPISYFSNYGAKTVDIFAPGDQIYSCVPGNSYLSYSGTSMAAPVVSGTAALVLSKYPGLKATDLRRLILETARTEDAQKLSLNLSTKAIAGGVIDAYALMQKVKAFQVETPTN